MGGEASPQNSWLAIRNWCWCYRKVFVVLAPREDLGLTVPPGVVNVAEGKALVIGKVYIHADSTPRARVGGQAWGWAT